MSYFESSIPLSDELKSFIIEAVSSGVKHDVLQFKNEHDLATDNGIHFLKWDFINTNLVRDISNDRLECIIIQRGGWKLVVIYDKETKFLYSLMSQNRFGELQKRTKKDTVHYIDGLTLINDDLEVKNNIQQLTLFDIKDERWEEERENVLSNILQCIDGEVVQYAVITFSTQKLELNSVLTYIPTADLKVAYKEDWSDYIPVDFDISNVITDNENEEEEEVEVRLRERVISKDDTIVQFKKHIKDKDKKDNDSKE